MIATLREVLIALLHVRVLGVCKVWWLFRTARSSLRWSSKVGALLLVQGACSSAGDWGEADVSPPEADAGVEAHEVEAATPVTSVQIVVPLLQLLPEGEIVLDGGAP